MGVLKRLVKRGWTPVTIKYPNDRGYPTNWCNENCPNEWRATYDTKIGQARYAFKDPGVAMMFTLKWK